MLVIENLPSNAWVFRNSCRGCSPGFGASLPSFGANPSEIYNPKIIINIMAMCLTVSHTPKVVDVFSKNPSGVLTSPVIINTITLIHAAIENLFARDPISLPLSGGDITD